MNTNDLIEEIYNIREEYAKRFDNNLEAIYNDASKKQGRDGRRVVLACPKSAHFDNIINGTIS